MLNSANFTTQVFTFDDTEEVLDWLRHGKEARAILGDGVLHRLEMNDNDEIIAKPVDTPEDEAEIQFLDEGDIESLLDCEDIIGVGHTGDADADYSRFAVC